MAQRTRRIYVQNKREQNKIYRDLVNGKQTFNTEAARRLLFDFHEVCAIEQATFFLAFGTLLGAYRDHDIIPYDTDIDVFMAGKSNHDKLIKLIESGAFSKKNIFVSRPPRNWSFIRDGMYLDVYPLLFDSKLNLWSGQISTGAPINHVGADQFPLKKIHLLGRYFHIPNDSDKFLKERYGENWKTPIKDKHARS